MRGCSDRRPRTPWLDSCHCHSRNSSADRRYRRNTSSSEMRPANTPATTSALRRTFQHATPAGGKSSDVRDSAIARISRGCGRVAPSRRIADPVWGECERGRVKGRLRRRPSGPQTPRPARTAVSALRKWTRRARRYFLASNGPFGLAAARDRSDHVAAVPAMAEKWGHGRGCANQHR